MVVARPSAAGGGVRGRDLSARAGFYLHYVLPEGYGVLEVSISLFRCSACSSPPSLLLLPFVRARPLVFGVALVGALSCLYIPGEEMSWGSTSSIGTRPSTWQWSTARRDQSAQHLCGLREDAAVDPRG